MLVGRAKATIGSKELAIVHLDEDGEAEPWQPKIGERLLLLGSMYEVSRVDLTTVQPTIQLDRPVGLDGPAPPAFVETGVVWIMREMRASAMNLDHQLLVRLSLQRLARPLD